MVRAHSAHELYAHVIVAEARALPDEKFASTVAQQRPVDLAQRGLSSRPVALFLRVFPLRGQAFSVMLQAAEFAKCDRTTPVWRMHDPRASASIDREGCVRQLWERCCWPRSASSPSLHRSRRILLM